MSAEENENFRFMKTFKDIAGRLKGSDIDVFHNSHTNEERIKVLYKPFVDAVKDPPLQRKCGKNQEEALKWKERGNKHFLKKDSRKAVDCYNAAIRYCPQNTSELKTCTYFLWFNHLLKISPYYYT